jgi:hypothetical protein
MNLFADTISPVKRSKPEELFLIRILAKPSPQNPEAAGVGGAYVNCWVDSDELRDAEELAIEAIESEQWQPGKFDHWELVCRRCYVDNLSYEETERLEILERVDEAFKYGISFTFNCWPPDAPEV